MTERETLHQKIAYHVYSNAAKISVSWPEPIARRVFRWGAAIAERVSAGARQTVAGNLSQVLGQPADSPVVRAAVSDAFRLYGRYWYESFRVGAMPDSEIDKRMQTEGAEYLDKALEAGKGVVIVMPHMGNWDAAGRWLIMKGYPMVSVAEALKPERLLRMFLDQRQAFGAVVLPLRKGAGVGKKLAKYLSENWIVGLIADRDLSGRGIEVEMFGATRTLPPGPAVLSLNSGAPLHVVGMYQIEGGWRARISPPLEIDPTGDAKADVEALTRKMAAEFERAIAAAPSDWHMFQPAWKQ